MKNLSRLLFGTIAILALFLTSCEKEDVVTEQTYSQEVERIYASHLSLQLEYDHSIEVSKGDIKEALTIPQAKNCTYQCCYTTIDLLAFLPCYGLPNPPSPTCSENADLNCDGLVNVLDYITLSSNWGCEAVEANVYNINGDLSNPANNIASQSLITAQLRNGTLIGGVAWQLSSNTIDEARWYYDGVLVSNNIPSLQLEFPGALPSEYDVAIDCNYGWHEVTLEVEVDCHTYSTTTCVQVKMQGVSITCKNDYCTP